MSVGVWQMACKRVVVLGERVVKDLVGENLDYVHVLSGRRADIGLLASSAASHQENEQEKKAAGPAAPGETKKEL